MYIRDWMARRAMLSPEKTALIDAATGARLSYRQLNERATGLANFLRAECGVGAQDRVAVLAPNRAQTLEAFFAAAKLTAILVPLNYRLAPPELNCILADCAPRVLLYEAEFAPLVNQLPIAIAHHLSFDQYEAALATAGAWPLEDTGFDAEWSKKRWRD